MGADEGMRRRRKPTADEQDVHTGWRKLYCWTQRAGATAKVKRRTRRRERQEAKRSIEEIIEQQDDLADRFERALPAAWDDPDPDDPPATKDDDPMWGRDGEE